MTLEQARETRNNYKHLIGEKAREGSANIHDVIIVPNDNFGAFINEYRMYMDDLDNDEILLDYSTNTYSVKVIYDADPEFVDIYFDDISVYQS